MSREEGFNFYREVALKLFEGIKPSDDISLYKNWQKFLGEKDFFHVSLQKTNSLMSYASVVVSDDGIRLTVRNSKREISWENFNFKKMRTWFIRLLKKYKYV